METFLDKEILVVDKKGKKRSLKRTNFSSFFQVEYFLFSKYPEDIEEECPFFLRNPFLEPFRLGKKYQHFLESGFIENISVCYIDQILEFGVFAEENLLKNGYVGEYTGIVRALSKKFPDHNPYCFHYPTKFWSKNFYVVDALLAGNELRFLNHSSKGNLYPRCLVLDRILHICFFAKRDIQKGEQLTFDYGKDFWVKNVASPVEILYMDPTKSIFP